MNIIFLSKLKTACTDYASGYKKTVLVTEGGTLTLVTLNTMFICPHKECLQLKKGKYLHLCTAVSPWACPSKNITSHFNMATSLRVNCVYAVKLFWYLSEIVLCRTPLQ